jgi:hypothetical protein
MSKKIIILLVAAAAIAGASGWLHVYYIYEGGNGNLFWKGDSAYLFVDLGSFGYRMTYLQFIAQNLKDLFRVGREPSDERYSTVVLKINSGNVHRYVFSDSHLAEYFVVNGSVLSGDLNSQAYRAFGSW